MAERRSFFPSRTTFPTSGTQIASHVRAYVNWIHFILNATASPSIQLNLLITHHYAASSSLGLFGALMHGFFCWPYLTTSNTGNIFTYLSTYLSINRKKNINFILILCFRYVCFCCLVLVKKVGWKMVNFCYNRFKFVTRIKFIALLDYFKGLVF